MAAIEYVWEERINMKVTFHVPEHSGQFQEWFEDHFVDYDDFVVLLCDTFGEPIEVGDFYITWEMNDQEEVDKLINYAAELGATATIDQE
ncbi:MAG TPA: hypothetical protein PLN86_17470 [Candidatus Hydrogenedentes bacterium]|nr:hypothetical protein [Candidatus Hydrogenedentota bacterium]